MLWESIHSVNASCPKFVSIDVVDYGLGDMLARIFSGVATTYLSQTTMVYQNPSWHHSVHYEKGYHQIFEEELGIPIGSGMIEKDALAKYQPTILPYDLLPDKSIFDPSFSEDMPCNSLVRMFRYQNCMANGKASAWCNSYITSSIQTVIRPFLDESIKARQNKDKLRELKFPLYFSPSNINIVWHIRSGDICLRCTNSSFYENINSFLDAALAKFPVTNIVVHEAEPKQPDRVPNLFRNIPNTVFHTSADVAEAVRLFLHCDVLITTGSSFVNHVALLSPLFHPVVLQSLDKDADKEYLGASYSKNAVDLIRDKYAIIDGRAIRIDSDGNILTYLPSDLLFLLSRRDILARVNPPK